MGHSKPMVHRVSDRTGFLQEVMHLSQEEGVRDQGIFLLSHSSGSVCLGSLPLDPSISGREQQHYTSL